MAAQVYRFESFRLDIRERQLLHDGRVIPMRGKVFDTLCALVRHSGRLLRKNELMQAIWPDTVVEENNLEHNLCVLRKILGQDKRDKKFIETVPRQGYRFVAKVHAFEEAGRSDFSPRMPPSPSTFAAGYSEAKVQVPVEVYAVAAEAEPEEVIYWGLA